MERVIDPVVTDLQTEYEEAVRAGCRRRAVRIRISGYFAFWKVVGLHALHRSPRALWNSIADDGWIVGRMIVSSVVALVIVTLLLTAWPMAEFYSRVHNLTLTLLLLPQAVALSIPIGLSLGIACSVHAGHLRTRTVRRVLVLGIGATLCAFAAMLMIPNANQAFRVGLAEELGMRGVTEYSLPRGMNELSLSELRRESQKFDAGGFVEKARLFKRTYHLRFAIPAATVVLSLLALVTGGVLRRRTRRAAAMVAALGLYWAALSLAEWNTSLPVAISVWAPNVVFTAISLAFLRIFSPRLRQRCVAK
jgi:hypothetical protein